MSVSKTPKVLILFAILALAAAVVVAGCGGGSSSSESTTTEEVAPPPKETEEAPAEKEAEPEEAGGGETAMLAEGKTIFTSTCGSCHTLKEAGTSGEVGPNLDELKPSETTVEQQVQNGGGGMPAFGNEGILKKNEIKAVSTYVSSVAGTE
jgi:mono/diheme cytochrome c family protein